MSFFVHAYPKVHFLYVMNMNHLKFTNTTTWELYNMAMEEQILHDHHQLPLNSLWSNNCPLQDHPSTQTLSSSSHFIGERQKIYNYNNNHQTDQEEQELAKEELGAMKEMMFKIAAMQSVDIDPATIRKPKRCNVRLSDDPQSVAARKRREKISEKIRILQRLVPGGTKMDTASMLEEAGRYIKFLKRQVRQLQGSKHHQSQCIGSAGKWPETRRKQQLHVVSTTPSSMAQITYNLGPRTCGL